MIQLSVQQMKYKFIIFMIFFINQSAFALTVTDDTGKTIHLSTPAKRIISLAPDATEILFAIGAGSQIKGRISASDYPADAKQILSIGGVSGIDIEKIVTMHPDLIITWGNSFSRYFAAFEKFGIPIYVTQPKQLEDVAKSMRNFGTLTHHEEKANKLENAYLTKLHEIKTQYESLKRVKVFFQIGAPSLFTINKNSWINQAIQYCGGHNVFADNKLQSAEVNMEAVLMASPDVIISDSKRSDWKEKWMQFNEIPAVKNHLLFAVNSDWIDRAGPRLAIGVEAICQFIDSYREPNRNL